MTEDNDSGIIKIKLDNQPHDICFHPNQNLIYTGLLTGEIKGFNYNHGYNKYERKLRLRPTKKSCRGLDISGDGSTLYSISKDGSLQYIDTTTNQIVNNIHKAHDEPISRVKGTLPNLLATGDDEGVIKLWDYRQPNNAVRNYTHHFDYISDFHFEHSSRHLISTSADGTLSVIDVRSNKPEPISHSEDQEDELLSIAPLIGTSKYVVGTQIGILSVFNSRQGFGDCVDRIPGHPSSIDTLVPLGPSIIATGSSDGLIRVMSVLPTKFMGVIGDHGEFPIERMKLSFDNKWLASISHNEELMLTNVEDLFEESDNEQNGDEEQSQLHDNNDEEQRQEEEEDERLQQQQQQQQQQQMDKPNKKSKKNNNKSIEQQQSKDFFMDL